MTVTASGAAGQRRAVDAHGRIEIRDLRVLGVHGALPEEETRAQPFSIDVDVWLDTRLAAATDELRDTADYGTLAQRAAAVVSGASFRLLEALADAVARDLVGADPRISLVAVTVRKLRPPVPLDVGSVGVRVVRDRGSVGGPGAPGGA
jgi:7,8-dihydroneopterin aldolase/epimerase/oxygenase